MSNMEERMDNQKKVSDIEAFRPLSSGKVFDADLTGALINRVSGGDNRLSHRLCEESVNYDESWIQVINGGLCSIEKILKTYKSGIAEERVIVPVEKVRRTTAETIRHLSSHTGYIRGLTEDGQVKPSKVLSTELREELAIYENRFVFSLIKKIMRFLSQRVDLTKERTGHHIDRIFQSSRFRFLNSDIGFEMKLTVKKPKEASKKAAVMASSIEEINKRIKGIQSTSFYKILSKAKPVSAPILKTNLLKMNVDYNNCYKTWLFISSFTGLGYSIDVREKNISFDGDYFDDLVLLTAASVKTMLENDIIRLPETSKIPYGERVRKFVEVGQLSFQPDHYTDTPVSDSDELFNQYYYEKLKSLLAKRPIRKKEEQRKEEQREDKEGSKAREDAKSKRRISITDFYKAVARLNNQLYQDMFGLVREPRGEKGKSLRELKHSVKRSKERLKVLRRLTKLMEDGLKVQLDKENKELDILRKAEDELRLFTEKKSKKQAKMLKKRTNENSKSAPAKPKEITTKQTAEPKEKLASELSSGEGKEKLASEPSSGEGKEKLVSEVSSGEGKETLTTTLAEAVRRRSRKKKINPYIESAAALDKPQRN